MINLEDGMTLCGRVACGTQVGWIVEITRDEYRVNWLDGATSVQLRPDDETPTVLRQEA